MSWTHFDLKKNKKSSLVLKIFQGGKHFLNLKRSLQPYFSLDFQNPGIKRLKNSNAIFWYSIIKNKSRKKGLKSTNIIDLIFSTLFCHFQAFFWTINIF